MFPEHPEKINPGFLVFLNAKQSKPIMFDIYDSDAVKLTGMNPTLPIYVISHGYLESGYKDWVSSQNLSDYHHWYYFVPDRNSPVRTPKTGTLYCHRRRLARRFVTPVHSSGCEHPISRCDGCTSTRNGCGSYKKPKIRPRSSHRTQSRGTSQRIHRIYTTTGKKTIYISSIEYNVL